MFHTLEHKLRREYTRLVVTVLRCLCANVIALSRVISQIVIAQNVHAAPAGSNSRHGITCWMMVETSHVRRLRSWRWFGKCGYVRALWHDEASGGSELQIARSDATTIFFHYRNRSPSSTLSLSSWHRRQHNAEMRHSHLCGAQSAHRILTLNSDVFHIFLFGILNWQREREAMDTHRDSINGTLWSRPMPFKLWVSVCLFVAAHSFRIALVLSGAYFSCHMTYF